MSNSIKPMTVVKWAVPIITLVLLAVLLPVNDIINEQMKLFLMITIPAVLVIAFEPFPGTIMTLALPLIYLLLGLADASTVWAAWYNTVVWMVIGAMLLVNILDKTGFLRRLSFKLISMFGKSYTTLLVGLGLTGVVLNIILFGNGYMFLAIIAVGFCQALEIPKMSKEAAGIFIACMVGAASSSIFVYGTQIMLLEGFGSSVYQSTIGFVEYNYMNLPFYLMFALCIGLVVLMYRSKEQGDYKSYAVEQLEKLGPMTIDEKKGMAWLILLFALVIWMGQVGKDGSLVFIVLPILMMLPHIGCGTVDSLKGLDLPFIFFVTGCLSIGSVGSALGFAAVVSQLAEPITAGATPTVIAILIYAVTVILNLLLTPFAIMASLTPVFTQIGLDVGINPYVIYGLINMGCDQVFFPYEYMSYLFYFAFGYFSIKEFIKFFSAKTVLATIFLIIILIPWWKLTGFFFV